MAGGIDWFRWHHGSVTDPKFALVARRAGCSLPDVLAVWICILEHGCTNGARVDAEHVARVGEFLALPAGRVALICEELARRGFIAGERIAQPRRYYPAPALRPSGGLWRSIRAFVLRRDNFTCRYCGQRAARMECDHVVPVADGGEHTHENLVAACFDCNRAKASMSLAKWEAARGW